MAWKAGHGPQQRAWHSVRCNRCAVDEATAQGRTDQLRADGSDEGTPWQPRDGVRRKITRELSQAIAFRAPATSGNPEREEAEDREYPTLGVDRHNVDHDALVVQAAAQLEEELEPMQDAEEFPDPGWPRRRQSCSNNASGIRGCRSPAARAGADRVSTAFSGSKRAGPSQ